MFPIQPAGPAAAEPLTAAEAALRLGVSRSTLYAYVSRGLLQAVANPDDPRRSLYAVHEVALLLRRRGRSRRPAAQALAALAEGLPLLETAVAGVVDGQPHYRGRPALPWARRATLEDTARLLWHAEPHDRIVDLLVDPFAGPAPVLSAAWRRALRDTSGQPPAERTLALLALALPDLPAPPWGADEATVLRACGAQLRVAMACFLGVTPDASPLHLQCQRAWGLPDAAAQPLREALVLGAENELNLPAFTARTVGSVGAPLGAAMLAGLCNITARFNGGATADVEVLWDDLLAGPRMPAAVRDRLARGDALPGFGPQAYPAGDPRAVRLLQLARRAGPLPPIAAEVMRRTGWSPSVDFGFVALRRSLGAPRGAALTLQFGSRCVGLLAHVLEQRRSGQRFAPRAVYTGG